MKQNVFITGGSGFLGKAIISRLVEVPVYDKIYMLVRSRNGVSSKARVEKIVRGIFPKHRSEELLGRIIAVEGELTVPGLGISEADLELLLKDVNQVLHVGASTEFAAPLGESRLNNVEGTRHVIALCKLLKGKGSFKRFDYISTAYVAGRLRGIVNEGQLDRGQQFSNNYEQTKFEAEVLVNQYRDDLKVAIYRPSIVVGDSNNGYTPHFKVLYWPILLLSRNLLRFFPTNTRAFLDVVPVDFVADGIVALMQRDDSVGETYHLTAGLGHEVRVSAFLKDAYNIAQIKPRPIVPFWLFNFIKSSKHIRQFFPESFWEATDLAKPYAYYLKGNGIRMDARRTHAKLAELGVIAPRWDDYKKEVLSFCRASRWGKKLPLPEYVYYLPVSSRKETWRELASEQQAIPSPV